MRGLVKASLPIWKQVALSIVQVLAIEAGVETVKIGADVIRFKIEQHFGTKVFRYEDDEHERHGGEEDDDEDDDDVDFRVQ